MLELILLCINDLIDDTICNIVIYAKMLLSTLSAIRY